MADPVSVATAFWDLTASGVGKFVSDLASALAWPMSAFLIVNLFKKEIIERIPRLSELTLPGGLSAKFNQGLAEIEAAVAGAQAPALESEPTASTPTPETRPDTDSGAPPSVPPNEPSSAIAPTPAPRPRPPITTMSINVPHHGAPTDTIALRANPTGVIMEAWKSLENMLVHFAIASGKPSIAEINASPRKMLVTLYSDGLITKSELATCLELFQLRNLAAHSSDRSLSEAEAQRFSEAVGDLLVTIQSRAFSYSKTTASA